jgi:hypothetical protein
MTEMILWSNCGRRFGGAVEVENEEALPQVEILLER